MVDDGSEVNLAMSPQQWIDNSDKMKSREQVELEREIWVNSKEGPYSEKAKCPRVSKGQ